MTLMARVLLEKPVPIWHIECENKIEFGASPVRDSLEQLAIRLTIDSRPAEGRHWVKFRGVPIERLRAVLQNGVDVDPTDKTIFCAEVDKAYEYARPEWGQTGPALVYALRGTCLERSFRVLPSDASPEQIAAVRSIYPHQYDDPRGNLRFSRLADQSNPAYEDAYGYWIPGNAREALLGVFILGQQSDVAEAIAAAIGSPTVDGVLPAG